MDGSTLQEILVALAVPSFTVLVAAVKAFFGKAPSPTKRKYWVREFPRRLELARANRETVLEQRLFARAEIALKHLDADEAIRRARIPGSTWSWMAAFAAYIFALAIHLQIADGEWTAGAYIIVVVLGLIGVWAQYDAIQTPLRRQQLSRTLVELMHLDSGYDDLIRSPEEIINIWGRNHKSIVKSIAENKNKRKIEVTSREVAGEVFRKYRKAKNLY